MRKVLIYRSRLLPISETFIRDHYDNLSRYMPILCGIRFVDGISTSDTRRILLEEKGRNTLQAARFVATGQNREFVQQIANEKPDLIHAHFAVDAVDMLPVVKKLGVPLIVTLHGYDAMFSDKAFRAMGPIGCNFLLKRKKLQREATQFLPVSDFLRNKALKAGYPDARMITHYLGIDLDRFAPGAKPMAERKTVLFIGRLVENKGLRFLIETMARIKASDLGFELKIIGDGPIRAELQSLADTLAVRSEFLGAQPHARVIDELRNARLFSMPSVRARSGAEEALGLVFLEAQAMGVPVLSFAHGGANEAVVDGETGYLAISGNIEDLAEKLRHLLNDPVLCHKLGAAGLERTHREFSARKQYAKLECIYDAMFDSESEAAE